MVLAFQDRFVPRVRRGDKRHTIRGKKRWRVGMRADLYEKSRRPGMKLIFRAIVTKVQDVTCRRHKDGMQLTVDLEQLSADECEQLARADGFESFAAMTEYWRPRFKKSNRWDGQIVHWDYDARFLKMSDTCCHRHIVAAYPEPPRRSKLHIMKAAS